MSEHSPGPWTACDAGKCVCGLVWSVPGDAPVAQVLLRNEEEGVTYPRHVVAANARLIAAAPELLVALKACVALERRLAKTVIVPTVIEDAEALIAKIEKSTNRGGRFRPHP